MALPACPDPGAEQSERYWQVPTALQVGVASHMRTLSGIRRRSSGRDELRYLIGDRSEPINPALQVAMRAVLAEERDAQQPGLRATP